MSFEGLEVGYDIPAKPGMAVSDIATPALVIDLDALEANLRKMGAMAAGMGVALRPHGKMHKSADVARLQHDIGGASGICCQKVSEAEAFIRAGITDVLVTNQVRGAKVDRLARLPLLGAKVGVCVDDLASVAELAEAAARHGTELRVLVEIECGGGRCGVVDPADVVTIAKAVIDAPGLTFDGIQAYHGSLQHVQTYADRLKGFEAQIATVQAAIKALTEAGIACPTVTGAGSGSFEFEGRSGIYTELQCGSYAFMDVDYGRIEAEGGGRLDGDWRNALFVAATIISKTRPGLAVGDAGLKAMTTESGLPTVFGRSDVHAAGVSDEHSNLSDPTDSLKIGDRLRLIPGHCDPTCNLHDWYVAIRGDTVEALWPVTARGKSF
ncbi:DSD1 family PLP-dependent enzyme [Pseudoprimorskyibacter insulae]|uniref:3-hydroxy-D-aspartate aldolase n=1 Tax=Pseudoprimorskyibacter insulae TaxID=1695997 RepID=A0A2R8ANR6_9RHOB|nr:DSD1 family PLP-dependent enzyme [Pseudoprimorskyibacter insulae]SPF77504.1 3-hydroxy-D-aspartate aldolase [Pseudoprimorskyibacter insulae]